MLCPCEHYWDPVLELLGAMTRTLESPSRCMELAEPAGQAAVCKVRGVRQAGEQRAGIQRNQEAT